MSEPNPTHSPQSTEPLPPGVELRPHEFDGIQEYDQRLPNWWLWTFYLAIIFFVAFWVCFYQFGWGRMDEVRINDHMKVVAAKAAADLEKLFSTDPDGALWKLSRNSDAVDKGKAVFMEKCVACHAKDLSAMQDGIKLAGLPLNDKEWKYGGAPFRPLNIFEIVKGGSPDKASGMQAWLPELGPTRVAQVVAFVLSHHEAPPEALLEKPAPPAGAPAGGGGTAAR